MVCFFFQIHFNSDGYGLGMYGLDFNFSLVEDFSFDLREDFGFTFGVAKQIIGSVSNVFHICFLDIFS